MYNSFCFSSDNLKYKLTKSCRLNSIGIIPFTISAASLADRENCFSLIVILIFFLFFTKYSSMSPPLSNQTFKPSSSPFSKAYLIAASFLVIFIPPFLLNYTKKDKQICNSTPFVFKYVHY